MPKFHMQHGAKDKEPAPVRSIEVIEVPSRDVSGRGPYDGLTWTDLLTCVHAGRLTKRTTAFGAPDAIRPGMSWVRKADGRDGWWLYRQGQVAHE